MLKGGNKAQGIRARMRIEKYIKIKKFKKFKTIFNPCQQN